MGEIIRQKLSRSDNEFLKKKMRFYRHVSKKKKKKQSTKNETCTETMSDILEEKKTRNLIEDEDWSMKIPIIFAFTEDFCIFSFIEKVFENFGSRTLKKVIRYLFITGKK